MATQILNTKLKTVTIFWIEDFVNERTGDVTCKQKSETVNYLEDGFFALRNFIRDKNQRARRIQSNQYISKDIFKIIK